MTNAVMQALAWDLALRLAPAGQQIETHDEGDEGFALISDGSPAEVCYRKDAIWITASQYAPLALTMRGFLFKITDDDDLTIWATRCSCGEIPAELNDIGPASCELAHPEAMWEIIDAALHKEGFLPLGEPVEDPRRDVVLELFDDLRIAANGLREILWRYQDPEDSYENVVGTIAETGHFLGLLELLAASVNPGATDRALSLSQRKR